MLASSISDLGVRKGGGKRGSELDPYQTAQRDIFRFVLTSANRIT